MSELTIHNAIGLAKYIHGMCVDEQPHGMVREKVRELIEMLHGLAQAVAEARLEEAKWWYWCKRPKEPRG